MMTGLKVYSARREQVLPPVRTVFGAPVYMLGLRAAQEEVFREANQNPKRQVEIKVRTGEQITGQKQQVTQQQKTFEELEKAKKQLNINTMILQQFGDEPQIWTIAQLDELSGTAKESLRPVIHKTENKITYQQKSKDPKEIQHQQIAGEAALVHHVPKEISGQVMVAGIKSINIQTAPSTQFQGNPIHELKVEKK
ncbi:MAG: hypothetical protein EZS28_016618 [Streblomastix strix]|uniref:Uncharacterized protein n=1 Tax=Streblomastix strix TaxID=222440 RepID=A0A5J4VZ73_9EUKA|nr:MAG: hypothetical protein EZS28_016618 [Streblomastix strix]